MVEAPAPEMFERAIFILKDDAFSNKNSSPDDVLREAERIAGSYVKSNFQRRRRRLPPIAYAACGAVISALISLALYLTLM